MKTKLLFFFSLCLTVNLTARPLIYDCFLFLNETEILDIRLHEMSDAVDKFVIVEATETFRGTPKPLNFPQVASRFTDFSEKIIYVAIKERLITDNPWERESFQRNQILRGLEGCSDKDIILISDVDEIVDHNTIPSLYAPLKKGRAHYVGVSHRYHSNFLNSVPGQSWRGTVATIYGILKKASPQQLRGMKDAIPAVAKGWHFTWQGGIDQVLYKMSSYSHAESDTPELRSQKIADAQQRLCPVIPIDESFPQYVRDNQSYFISIGYILEPS